MRLLSQVSIQELQHMRDEGLTNKEIANRLDISVSSVYRVIGKQPKELDRRKTNARASVESEQWDEINADSAALSESLKVAKHEVSIEGKFCDYKVSVSPSEPEKKFSLSIRRHGDTLGTYLEIQGEEISDFLREISSISSQFSKL